MTIVVPNGAEERMLRSILSETVIYRLYTNNYAPTETSEASDFTEAAGLGYVSAVLTPGGWNYAQGVPTVASYANQTFSFTGALGTVYGYFVTRQSDGALMWAESFATPVLVDTSGDSIMVSPRFSAE